MAKKPAGLNKKVSSIFSGIPNLDEEVPPPGSRLHISHTSSSSGMAQISKMKDALDYTAIFNRRPKLLFEIGASRIKVALMFAQSGEQIIEAALEHEFPADERGERLREDETLAAAVKSLADQLDPLHQAQTGLTISSSNVFTATIPEPEQPKKDWRDAIVWQFAESSLFPLEEAEIHWVPIREMVLDSAKLIRKSELPPEEDRILVSAVWNEELEKVTQLFKQADRELEFIVPAPIAIDWLMQKYRKPLPAVTVLIDFGAENSRLYFLHHGRFIYMRQAHLGCDHIQRALVGTVQVDQEKFQINFEDALKLIKECRLLSTTQSLDPSLPKRAQLAARLRPVTDKLLGEIRRSLSFFQSEFRAGEIKEIFLLGSGSNLEEFPGFLNAELNIPVSKLDLATDFHFKIKGDALENVPSLKQAFGPVMGLGIPQRYPINFANWQNRWRPWVKQAKQILKLASVAVVVLGILSLAWASLRQIGLNRELDTVKKQLETAGPKTMQLEELGSLANSIQEKKAKLAKAIPSEPLWWGVLRELSHVVPRDMLLDRIDVSEEENTKNITLQGFIRNAAGPGDIIVSELLKSLNGSPFFRAAALLSRQQEELDENTRSTFRVKAQLL